jgi:hypothetical protein
LYEAVLERTAYLRFAPAYTFPWRDASTFFEKNTAIVRYIIKARHHDMKKPHDRGQNCGRKEKSGGCFWDAGSY